MEAQQAPVPGDPEAARNRSKRKFRPRVSQACQMCRVKKAKCDQGRPCQTCLDREFVCVYDEKRQRRGNGVASPAIQNGSPTDLKPMQQTPRAASYEDMSQRFSGETSIHESESVGAVNRHTGGTEFYGKSSSVALLSQLFTETRRKSLSNHFSSHDEQQSPQSGRSGENGNESPGLSQMSPQNNDQMAIVNILYDESSAIPESRPGSPVTVAGRRKLCALSRAALDSPSADGIRQEHHPSEQLSRQANGVKANSQTRNANNDSLPTQLGQFPALSTCLFGQPLLLEVESRCEQEIWSRKSSERLRRDQMHFLALYNAVLAAASLTAGVDLFQDLRTELDASRYGQAPANPNDVVSNVHLSKIYFQRARKLLGNVFEVCSLESTQTLLLMSVYCQQALKPHSAFLYSGMAARTAVSIGLSDESGTQSPHPASASRKLWWNIYSHETEISCSSGRPSSLATFEEYEIPFPELKKPWHLGQPTSDECHVLVIAQMARLYAVLHRASKDIYHSSKKVSLQFKSRRALDYDEDLDKWKSSLPPWLSPGMIEWREPEWAIKQKLSLQLRYYSARMFLHRAFISTPSDEFNPNFVHHSRACLQTARQIISVVYDAYMHRHYFRTLWYNCTYTLHACVAVLYVIMMDKMDIPTPDLIVDVEKGLKVLEAMSDMVVSSRCATLVREILSSLSSTKAPAGGISRTDSGRDEQRKDLSYAKAMPSESRDSSSSTAYESYQDPLNDSQSWSFAEFSVSRDDFLANLMDPNIMQGFATDFSNQSPQNFDLNIQDMRWEIGLPFETTGNAPYYPPS